MRSSRKVPTPTSRKPYVLDAQIGFILRQVVQRHVTIFDQRVGKELTPTQWAALAKLAEVGECSQNHLGRLTAMDVATIKGVIDRLSIRGLIGTTRDPADGRRLLINLTRSGEAIVRKTLPGAFRATDDTLAPLTPEEQKTLTTLLLRLR